MTKFYNNFTNYFNFYLLKCEHFLINGNFYCHFSYPPEEAKWALAKAIVTEFPKLRDSNSEHGCVSNFLFY